MEHSYLKMRKPIVENVEEWTNHYKAMAEGKIPSEDMYVLNQQGRGLANNRRGKIIYKISKPHNTSISPQIISPVAQGIDQAQSMVKSKAYIKTGTKKKKPQSKKTAGWSQKKIKKKNSKKTTKKKTIKKKKKDIFG